jgi:hypothetical protein
MGKMFHVNAGASRGKRFRSTVLAGIAAVAVAATAFVGLGNAEDPKSIETAIYRITPEQYQNIITDVFGKTVKAGGRFEPGTRIEGLIAAGASVASVSGSGLQGFDSTARDVAAQVVSPQQRGALFPCEPASARAPDDACTTQFFTKVGKLLLRRPLSAEELSMYVAMANASATSGKDFYAGIATALSTMLISPEFLFWREVATPDKSGGYQIDPYSKASKLSFFLWNSAPDEQLLTAAEKGELNTPKGLQKQVDRLLNSPRLEAGLRAFFEDYLHYDAFGSLAKDATIYPNFTSDASEDAKEQTLRTIVDHLLVRNGDYRGLFTTRHTFLTPLLGTVYGIPVVHNGPNGSVAEWVPHDFAPEDAHAGILTHASFLSLHSHPGRSSPTIRGKAVREVFLCQKVPDPPGNVEFNVIQDTANPNFKTARARLNAHATEPMCSGCHKITDPIGLALENFDSDASFRLNENGAELDTKGAIDGISFVDAPSLGKALHDHPNLPKCFATRVFQYATGRQVPKSENAWIATLTKEFSSNGYRMRDLLRTISVSDKFYEIRLPGQQASVAKGE